MLLMGRGSAPTAFAEPYVQPAFTIKLGLADPAHPTNSLTLEIAGVRFENWRFSIPEDEFVVENLCFRALTIRVVDRDGGAGGAGGGGGGGGEPAPTTVAFATP